MSNEQTKTPGAMVCEDLQVLRELKADADQLGETLDDVSLAELVELERNYSTEQPPAVGGEPEVFVHRYSESSGEGGGVYAIKDGELCDYHHVERLTSELATVRQVLAATRDARDAAQYRIAELEVLIGDKNL